MNECKLTECIANKKGQCAIKDGVSLRRIPKSLLGNSQIYCESISEPIDPINMREIRANRHM